MATLLPPPEQQWIDANGEPIAGGSVAFYVPSTFTPKDTFKDAGATILNANPVILDSAGRAVIYGSGSYRAVVKDADGNLIYDQLTADTSVGGLAFGGTSTGTPNAQVIAASSFTQQDGQQISFIVGAGLTNTDSTTVAPGGSAAIAILKNTLTGPTALTGGELAAGDSVTLIYDAVRGAFRLAAFPLDLTPSANSITNGMLAQAPAYTLKGNNTGGTADETDLTGAQVRTVPGITLSGYLFGLTLSNDATTPATVLDIAAGEAASSNTGPTILSLGSAFTKKINAAWAAGTGNGALDTGTFANTTYHIFIIGGVGVSTDILASTSATNPTLPAGYTLFRRIGSIIVQSSAILAFVQTGNDFFWNTTSPPSDIGAGISKSLVAVTVPIGIRVLAYFQGAANGVSGTGAKISLYDGNAANIGTYLQAGSNNNSFWGPLHQYTNTSAQVYADTTSSVGATASATTLGWHDLRGALG